MSAEQEGRQKAEEFRRTHGLGCQPLGDLVALIEQTTGHDVAVLDAGADEHGLTMHDPERDVTFIGVARTRRPMRQRSTLAHELAHALFADWADSADLSVRSPEEIRADSFARHLLLPAEGLREMLGEPRALAAQDLSRVVQRFLVSPALAAIALHGSGYIDATTKTEWMSRSTPQLATLFGWRDQYQSLQADADRPRPPQRLLARAVAGYEEGAVPLQTLASLRSLSMETIELELREAGITPLEPAPPQLAAADLPPVSVDLSDIDEPGAAQNRPV
ncbi:UNVERIFIED_CONTAM: ImmA/IrrE family metallo-endopeptidase [Kocuria sp. CPCC 205295]|uniref:ImmA/IrrE family metallo-endopeptidase n=1 Tax=unclassified Kocuria TaxID=2649579 RepID=UPI0034D3A3B7